MDKTYHLRISEALPGFVDYMAGDRGFASTTVKKYKENIDVFLRHIGDLPIADLGLEHFTSLKARLTERGGKEARVASVICAVKSLLGYARDMLHIPITDLARIRVPRRPRREVVYLTADELDRFLEGIPLRTWAGRPRLGGYRFRALAETLVATAMRISEALSLDRDSIDVERSRAKIVGKGNKERYVFFTDRALDWIRRYVDLRIDAGRALFVSQRGTRMTVNTAEALFRRHTRWLGSEKAVTPHIIRHTVATNLLHNGCPMGFIKEIMGHQRLETTCRFYLGVLSQEDAQAAHRQYANFGGRRGAANGRDDRYSNERSSRESGRSLTPDINELHWKHQP